MNPAQLRALWKLYDEACSELGRPLAMRAHGDGDATACPGPGIRHQLNAGRPTIPNPPTEDNDMQTARRIRLKGTINEFLIGAGPPLHLTGELAAAYAELPVIEVAMTPQIARTLATQAGFTPELVVGRWELAK
jgi:hypothetical protein